MLDLEKKVSMFCAQHNLIKPQSTIIVGLSGGPDSVCLLTMLKNFESSHGLKLIAAHLDHGWRENSAQDAQFCKDFALKNNVQYVQAQAADISIAKKYNGSQEELGRFLRRQFFQNIAQEYAADAIALAHHQDDQQETFFMRMMRGASLTGLSSMRPLDGLYIRPLLDLYKQEILEYLAQENVPYVLDDTNENTAFLRNAIRHNVIPALRTSDERFDKTFHKTLNHIQQTEEFLERIAQHHFREITSENDGLLLLDGGKFLSIDPFLQHRLILLWLCKAQVPFTPSTAFFDEIVRFFKNKNKQHQIHQSWYILKNKNMIEILRN